MSMELREIPNFPDYRISSDGRVWSLRTWRGQTGRWMRGKRTSGYAAVTLYRDGKQHDAYVHHLVAEAFHGPRPDDMEIRHLNGDKLDNRPENLAYGTHAENVGDTLRHGTHNHASKTRCPQGHPYSGGNLITSSRGWRYCRTCKNANMRSIRRRLTHVEVRRDDPPAEDGGGVPEGGQGPGGAPAAR